MRWGRRDAAIVARCLEETFSLTWEDEVERIEEVEVLKLLGRLLDRLDNDLTSVLWNIQKARQVWGCIRELLRREVVDPNVLEKFSIVWSGDMGEFWANGADVRGSTCGFPTASHKKKCKATKGRVVVAGDRKNSPPGSGETSAPNICGQETGVSGGVGGPTDYFWRLYKSKGLWWREETLGAMVEAGWSVEAAEGHGRNDFGSGKAAAATGIRQAWRERGRVEGGRHGQRRVWARQGTLVF